VCRSFRSTAAESSSVFSWFTISFIGTPRGFSVAYARVGTIAGAYRGAKANRPSFETGMEGIRAASNELCSVRTIRRDICWDVDGIGENFDQASNFRLNPLNMFLPGPLLRRSLLHHCVTRPFSFLPSSIRTKATINQVLRGCRTPPKSKRIQKSESPDLKQNPYKKAVVQKVYIVKPKVTTFDRADVET
jgi:hypothetical protein